MKPIRGSVVSSKPVSLSKATSILSRFVAASGPGVPQDVSAFLRRTSEAVGELARFHRELGAPKEGAGGGDDEEVGRRKKERKNKVGAVLDKDTERRRMKEEVDSALEASRDASSKGNGSDRATDGGRRGDSALELEESRGGSREKKRATNVVERGVGIVVKKVTEKHDKLELKITKIEDAEMRGDGEGDAGDHSERRRKKNRKEDDVKKENHGRVDNHFEEEGSDGYRGERRQKKKRQKEDVKESGGWTEHHIVAEGNGGNHSERPQKKKRKRVEDVEEEGRDWVDNHAKGKRITGDHSYQLQKKIKKEIVKEEVGIVVEYQAELNHQKRIKVKKEP